MMAIVLVEAFPMGPNPLDGALAEFIISSFPQGSLSISTGPSICCHLGIVSIAIEYLAALGFLKHREVDGNLVIFSVRCLPHEVLSVSP